MKKAEVAKFKSLFNDWASSDVQMKTQNGDFGDGTQHQFIGFLLMYREPIISAMELAARD